MRRFWTRFAVLALTLVLMQSFITVSAEGNQYRRWVDDKTYSCTTGAGVVYANLNNQNVEFNNLPASAQFTINYIDNGVNTPDGPYPVEQTSGTKAYGAFAESFPAYPFTFEFRLDTIIDGLVVYSSSITISCSGDTASTPVTPVNVDTGFAYRRWLNNKTYSCTTGAGVVYANLSNQDVEFNNLPVGAEFTLNYIDNGVVTTNGPYPVEQANGTKVYGAFAQPFPSYPFTFEFRIDTLISGVVVYTSSLTISCTGDTASTPITPVSGPPGGPGSSSASAPTCLITLPANAVQGRVLTTTTALYSPDPATTTNIVLEVGKAWWVIGAQDGYYRLWIACNANALWVPAEALGPNYDMGGAPLPVAG